MKLEFAITLVTLTAFYGLLFVLFGGGFLSETRQRQLSYATVGVGFLLVYVMVTVLVVWIAPSWVFAIVCASTLALWLRLSLTHRARVVPLVALSVRHALTVAAVAFLFWMPGMLGQTSGLFTEAGGDFTIYAGLPAKLGDQPLWKVSSREVGPFRLKSVPLSAKSDPPSAGWSMNGIVEGGFGARNPGWYSLQHVLFQASWGPLELQYLAMLAVLWAVVVLSLQRLVRVRYGRLAGLAALLVLVSSHGLAAVGYNHYLPQLLATTLVASTALLLALPGAIALPRTSRVWAAALCVAFIGIAYYPMLPAAVVPVFLLIGLWHSTPSTRASRARSRNARAVARKSVVFLGGIYLVVTVAALYAAQARGILEMLSSLAAHEQNTLVFLGRPRAYDLAWLDALFGGFSLQMLPPWATVDPSKSVAAWLLAAAYFMLALGLAYVLVRSWRQARRFVRADLFTLARSLSGENRFRMTFAVALILFISIEVVLGRKYEYTQFKALAYVMPFTLLGGVLTASWLLRESRRPIRALACMATVLLIGSLAFLRVDGATRIAEGRDRTGVLSLEVTGLARDVRAHHPKAFLLALPAHVNEYPLWDLGLRDNRGLILRFYKYAAPTASYVRPADVPHLWVLQGAPDGEKHPRSLTRGRASAYPAAAAARCSVLAAVLRADNVQPVAFAPLGSHTSMRYDSDVDYWIFGAKHASKVEVLVKDHQALRKRGVAAQLLFPVSRKLLVPVSRVEQHDALAQIATTDLPRSDLVVLRIPGTGYSDARCN